MMFILSAAETITNNADDNLIERFIFGLVTAVVMILILWILIRLSKSVTTNANKRAASVGAAELKELPGETGEEKPVSAESVEDDGALIAVLTAAIMEYNKAGKDDAPPGMEEIQEGKGFRIVAFKERNRVV